MCSHAFATDNRKRTNFAVHISHSLYTLYMYTQSTYIITTQGTQYCTYNYARRASISKIDLRIDLRESKMWGLCLWLHCTRVCLCVCDRCSAPGIICILTLLTTCFDGTCHMRHCDGKTLMHYRDTNHNELLAPRSYHVMDSLFVLRTYKHLYVYICRSR